MSVDHVHEQQVVENINLEHRESLYKVSQCIHHMTGRGIKERSKKNAVRKS